MTKRNKILLVVFLAIDVLLLLFSFCLIVGPVEYFPSMVIFNPKGVIAQKELNLLVKATLTMLSIIIPVFIITALIVWKYRANSKPTAYLPDLRSNFYIGLVLWLIPSIIIFIIGNFIWTSTHELDPRNPIVSNIKPITIQVVALNWKWLFIYPDYNIASVNFVEFPNNVPIVFRLTADNAPMSSFWIPQLGGQMYAMAGMENKLHLIANEEGDYAGLSAEINGKGFAGMKFIAKATSQNSFDSWVSMVREQGEMLNTENYSKLIEPSENTPKAIYGSVEDNLYSSIMKKYMTAENLKYNKETIIEKGMEIKH